MLNKIRNKVLEKKEMLKASNVVDVKSQTIINTIEELLLDDACFIKLDISTAIAVLVFLGYTKDEAKELYISLVQESSKKMSGHYTLINFKGEHLKK